jgi:squalene-associated FAD-dependent desaturase
MDRLENLDQRMTASVAVIGGGYAGMAAAVDLAKAGINVHLFEAAKQLGGRARGVVYEESPLDNGQHILIGAYRETLDLIKLVHNGSSDQLLYRLPFEVTFPDVFHLKTAPLPPPFHLMGIMTAAGITIKDKIAAATFYTQTKIKKFQLAADCSVAELLRKYHQTPRIIEYLWEPLCVAALNTPIQNASAQIFLNTLKDSLVDQTSSEILIPKINLSSLFPDAAAKYIASKNSVVECSATVLGIEKNNSGYSLQFKDRQLQFQNIVCAVAPQHLERLTSNMPALSPVTQLLENYTYEPIYTLYFQYPENVSLPGPMFLLDGKPGQWIFDRGLINNTKGLLAVVISANGKHQQLMQEKLAEQAQQQLSRFWNLPTPIWHKVIAEKRATFACTPNLKRPAQITAYQNFLLAGDYTEANYPATIEAAVRSGRKAAKHLIERLH